MNAPIAKQFCHQVSTADAYALSDVIGPMIGNKLLQRVSLFLKAAPSHSRFGTRNAMSARLADW